MTVIYMDAAMRLQAPRNDHQAQDHRLWCPGALTGEIIDTRKNPRIWPLP